MPSTLSVLELEVDQVIAGTDLQCKLLGSHRLHLSSVGDWSGRSCRQENYGMQSERNPLPKVCKQLRITAGIMSITLKAKKRKNAFLKYTY